MNGAEALPTVGAINTTENVTDFTHEDLKQLAAKVLKEKQHNRDNYLEMEQRYREGKGSKLEEDSDSEGPIEFNSKRHHRIIEQLLKYNFTSIIYRRWQGHAFRTKKLERGKGKKISDEQRGSLIVLGKPAENFNLNLFFERYPEAIGYVLKIRDICTKRITEWDNTDPQDPVNKAKLKRKKAAITEYFNDVESNDDEDTPRAPANENETADKDVFESKDLAELSTSSLPERKRPRSSENEDSLCTRIGKMFRLTPLIKNLRKHL